MNVERRAVAEELLTASREHDAAQEDRVARYRNLEPDSAELLGVLVKATAPRRILELGTSNGYSTIWLADAAEATGAQLVSVEIDSARTEQARRSLERAGLRAALIEGDAGLVLRESGDGAWDFVFLDAERPAYAGYWPDLVRVLAPGALLVIDNVISHAEQVEEVTALIEAEPAVTTALVPIGAGLRVVVKDGTP
ncbi:MAG TPA: class I SAM-dependent methyltransferase [Solirubrobacteraceae bacterium]|nr:class I SAM-dependent methyltransferase [Solirubrobacteraceae bacterium]